MHRFDQDVCSAILSGLVYYIQEIKNLTHDVSINEARLNIIKILSVFWYFWCYFGVFFTKYPNLLNNNNTNIFLFLFIVLLISKLLILLITNNINTINKNKKILIKFFLAFKQF